MSQDINTCTFTGRLTRDCEQKTLPTGSKLVSFDIANNTGFGDYAKVLYLTVNLWGKSNEKVAQYLTKGTLVGVTGSLEVQQWTSKQDNSQQKKNVISTMNVTLLSSGSKATNDGADIMFKVVDDDDDDDVRF